MAVLDRQLIGRSNLWLNCIPLTTLMYVIDVCTTLAKASAVCLLVSTRLSRTRVLGSSPARSARRTEDPIDSRHADILRPLLDRYNLSGI